ncbi:NACHT domain-containing protein [Micromonospora sp. NPDC047074]|uniref:NACHT domain-containing protein n=1 Tax=Micromonospora sp. NPDC047074 TaxID=3154339 RepID=UPI0033C26009
MWRDDSWRSLRWGLAVLALLLTLGAGVSCVAQLSERGLDRADKIASVGSLLVGITALLLSGMALRSGARTDGQSTSATNDPTTTSDRAVASLAEAVRRQWATEVELRQLRQPHPLRLRWSSSGRPVSPRPDVVLGGGPVAGRPTRLRLHGDLETMVSAFHQLPRRQLVVLGEPGAGKTVLAILFTLGLLDSRPPAGPVPVLVALSSWNPDTEHLYGWLARRLVEDYPALGNVRRFGPDAADRLVRNGRLVPVLDGLDELPPALHTAALAALDQALNDGAALVLTCRSAEYQAAVLGSGRFLSRAAVVEIEPVDAVDSIAFLAAAQPVGDRRWKPVFDRLAVPGDPLARALSTPLMVYLARVAYTHPSTDPAELCDRDRFGTVAALEGHLLDAYLPAVYRHHPNLPQAGGTRPAAVTGYRPEQAHRWLAWLARHLHHQQTGDLAWWQLHRALPQRGLRPLGGAALGLVDGLATAVAVGIGLGPGGFVAGLAGGLTAEFVAGAIAGPPAQPRQVDTRLRWRQRPAGREFTAGLTIGLGIGLSIGLVAGLSGGIDVRTGVTAGLLGGLATGLTGGVTQWLNTPADTIRSPSPPASLRDDRTASVLRTFVAVFLTWLAVGLVIGTVVPVVVDPYAGLAVGLAGGLVAGVAAGLADRHAAGNRDGFSAGLVGSGWAWSLVSRSWLAATGKLPWNLTGFLDDAHRRGVLRQAGAVYQFRHASLQERLRTGSDDARLPDS